MNYLDCCDAEYSSNRTESRYANCRHDFLSLSMRQHIPVEEFFAPPIIITVQRTKLKFK